MKKFRRGGPWRSRAKVSWLMQGRRVGQDQRQCGSLIEQRKVRLWRFGWRSLCPIICVREIVIVRVGLMRIVVLVVVGMMVVGMNLVDDAGVFEQGVRSDGGPDGRQKQRNDASDKSHRFRLAELYETATLIGGGRGAEGPRFTFLRAPGKTAGRGARRLSYPFQKMAANKIGSDYGGRGRPPLHARRRDACAPQVTFSSSRRFADGWSSPIPRLPYDSFPCSFSP